MQSTDLLMICVSAFVSVFVLLTLLAVIMRLIIVFFPQKKAISDAAVLAAVTTVMHNLYPGTKVTRIEEKK
jgi:hypothetical protein